MGLIQVDVTVTNPRDTSKSFVEKFWADTCALYTYIPEDRLHAIALETDYRNYRYSAIGIRSGPHSIHPPVGR